MLQAATKEIKQEAGKGYQPKKERCTYEKRPTEEKDRQ